MKINSEHLTNLEQDKIIAILEFYLSLHEADEIYNLIFNDDFTVEEVKQRLDEIREGDE